jgi:hypothetical protein
MAEQIAATIPQAAELVGLSPDSIRRAIRMGELVPRYPTSKPVILLADLRAWVESSPTSPR